MEKSTCQPVTSTEITSERSESADNGKYHIEHQQQNDSQLLDRLYVYQNGVTGTPSASPLSVRQLCRILCPEKPTTASSHNSDGELNTGPSIIHAETLVIGIDYVTGQYSAQGWVQCRYVPVLREACANWHYQDTLSGQVKGPISARRLAYLSQKSTPGVVNNSSNHVDSKADDAGSDDATPLNVNSFVWSAEIAATNPPTGTAATVSGTVSSTQTASRTNDNLHKWRSIASDLSLQTALEAFRSGPIVPAVLAKSAFQLDAASNESRHIFDPLTMTYTDDDNNENMELWTKDGLLNPIAANAHSRSTSRTIEVGSSTSGNNQFDGKEKFDEFLASTGGIATSETGNDDGQADDENDDDEEGFESDGGTVYVRNRQTGDWVKEPAANNRQTLVGKRPVHSIPISADEQDKRQKPTTMTKKKKRRTAQFTAKNAARWIYVNGLPKDTDEDEVATYFSKVGILELDPETQHAKVKLYRYKADDENSRAEGGGLKGDASICFARAESVDLAVQILDESIFRVSNKPISVTRAKFEQKGEKIENKPKVSDTKRKIARLAAVQAVDWDEGEHGRISGGLKGLRIIVLKGMFTLRDLSDANKEDIVLREIEHELRTECESSFGAVEKLTIFAKNPAGVVVVKFVQPPAASAAVKELHGRPRGKRKIEALFWDGATDYSIHEDDKEAKEADKRQEEFGKWLDNQEIPEEFMLKSEVD